MKQFNVIAILAIIILSLSISSCKKDDDTTTTPTAEMLAYESINCQTFFNVGDYSGVCGFTNPLPISFEFSGNEEDDNCAFSVTADGVQSNFLYTVVASIFNSVSSANSNFDLNVSLDLPSQYAEGFITEYIEEMKSGIGDRAFLTHHVENGQRGFVTLLIVVENAMLRFENFYQLSEDKPCYHEDEEIIKFAEEFISNM